MGDNLTAEQIMNAVSEGVKSAMGKTKGGANLLDSKDMETLVANVKKFSQSLKEQQPLHRSLGDAIRGNQVSFMDMGDELKRLEKALKDASEEAEHSNDASKREAAQKAKGDLESAKSGIKTRIAWDGAITAAAGLASAFLAFKFNMLNVSMDFAAGLVAGKSGNDLYTESAKGVAKANQELRSTILKLVEGALAFVTILAPELALVTVPLGLMAVAADKSSAALTELYTKGLDLLNSQLNKTIDGFKAVNSVGASLAGGMTELTALGIESGVGIKTLSEGIKNSSESINNMGMSFSDATARIASVSKTLHTMDANGNSFAKQLDKLGYSVTDQVELTANVLAKLNIAGDKRASNDAYVASVTMDYAKGLKILDGITGGHAKEAQRKAEQEAMEGILMARAAQAGPGGQKRMEALLAGADKLTGSARQGILEILYSNGKFVKDAGANMLMRTNKDYANLIHSQIGLLQNTSAGYEDTVKRQADLIADAGSQQIQVSKSNAGVGLAIGALFGENGTVKSAYEGQNSLIRAGIQITKDKIAKDQKNIKSAANNQAILDENNAKSIENTNALNAKMDKDLLPQLGRFTTNMVNSNAALVQFEETMRNVISYVNSIDGMKKSTPKGGPVPGGGGGMHGPGGTTAPAGMEFVRRGRGGTGIRAQELPEPGTAGYARSGAAHERQDALKNLITFAGGNTGNLGNFQSLDPNVRNSFIEMVRAFGHPVRVTSAKREADDQARLYKEWKAAGGDEKTKPTAAGITLPTPPGKKDSHTLGRAIDISKEDFEALRADPRDLIGTYGFQTVGRDPGHLQMMDAGGVVGPTGSALVGEKGNMEIVSGGAQVHGSHDTYKLFQQMSHHLEELVKMMHKQNLVSSKMLKATA